MSPDPYISIHMYLKLLCKIHVSDSCLSIFIPQGPLQDPYVRVHVSTSTCISGTSARSMSPDPCISIHIYLRILCKNHVSDSCLSIYIYLRVLCKIHVFGFMSQHRPISGFSARSMCPIHVLAFMSQHLYISGSSARSMSRFMSQHLCISGFSTGSMSSDSLLSIH